MKGLEAVKILYEPRKQKYILVNTRRNACRVIEKELKAFDFLAKELRVKVGVDTNNRDDVNFACLGVLIDDKFYIVDSAYENENPEKYKQLLELSEVLKND